MKGLIRLAVVLGCVTAAAEAAPEARIVCSGEPRVEGADKAGVEISTDAVGLVRVVDGLDEGDDAHSEKGDPVLTAEEFCASHEGIDTFILPAPRMIDTPRPGEEGDLELEEPGRREMDDKGDDQLEVEDDDSGGGGGEQSSKSASGLPSMDGHYKSIDPQMQTSAGCSQAADHAETGWWFALLPLLLLVRVRREGDR